MKHIAISPKIVNYFYWILFSVLTYNVWEANIAFSSVLTQEPDEKALLVDILRMMKKPNDIFYPTGYGYGNSHMYIRAFLSSIFSVFDVSPVIISRMVSAIFLLSAIAISSFYFINKAPYRILFLLCVISFPHMSIHFLWPKPDALQILLTVVLLLILIKNKHSLQYKILVPLISGALLGIKATSLPFVSVALVLWLYNTYKCDKKYLLGFLPLFCAGVFISMPDILNRDLHTLLAGNGVKDLSQIYTNLSNWSNIFFTPASLDGYSLEGYNSSRYLLGFFSPKSLIFIYVVLILSCYGWALKNPVLKVFQSKFNISTLFTILENQKVLLVIIILPILFAGILLSHEYYLFHFSVPIFFTVLLLIQYLEQEKKMLVKILSFGIMGVYLFYEGTATAHLFNQFQNRDSTPYAMELNEDMQKVKKIILDEHYKTSKNISVILPWRIFEMSKDSRYTAPFKGNPHFPSVIKFWKNYDFLVIKKPHAVDLKKNNTFALVADLKRVRVYKSLQQIEKYKETILNIVKRENLPIFDDKVILLPLDGLNILFENETNTNHIDMSYNWNDKLKIIFFNNKKVVETVEILPKGSGYGMTKTIIKLPNKITFDSVKIFPVGGLTPYGIGHFIVK